ncbi:MAG: hypothetical protein ACRDN6_00310 [Gaiellaceae bacterium]
MALERLRGRMPHVAFILLALVCLALFGFACACLSDSPALALERALQGPTLPALVEIWPLVVLALGGLLAAAVAVPEARERASPARLQRFLF